MQFGSEDYAKAGAAGRANKNLARDLAKIATKSVDLLEHDIANIPLGQGDGHPPMES